MYEIIDKYIDNNPIQLGIYSSENGKRILQTTYINNEPNHFIWQR